MKRRDFLKNGMLLTGSAALAPFLSTQNLFASQNQAGKFFLQVSFTGGWHTSLSLDPWLATERPSEKDAFIEYRADQILKEGQLFFGPAMQSMRPFASQLNIINGIYISSNDSGHESAEIYMNSGSGSGHFGAIAVEHELVDQQYPLGVLSSSDVYKGQSAVSSSNISLLSNLETKNVVISEFDDPNSPIVQSQLVISQNAVKIQSYNQAISALAAGGVTLTDGHRIALAYRHGLAANAFYSIFEGYLDTHAAHEGNHLTRQAQNWEELATLLNSFKQIEWSNGQSMYDVTTFYVTSEFSRTPALNAAKGTDHNPLNNSALIIGPGFKGNTVFGASRLVTSAESASGASYLVAQMVDMQTGALIKNKQDAKEKGQLIKPETIIATLAEGLGVQRNIFPVINENEKAIRQILK
ncbi:MAG: DUF1501 domain-containing protein [Bdellovibrionota bacterium]